VTPSSVIKRVPKAGGFLVYWRQPLIAHIGLQSQGFIPTRPQGRVGLRCARRIIDVRG